MQLPYRVDFWTVGKRLDIEAQASLDVFLREIVAVNQHFADLVHGIGIFALVGVVVLQQELAVAGSSARCPASSGFESPPPRAGFR